MEENKKELSVNEMEEISGGANKSATYRCTKPGCGYSYQGMNPPKRCPQCGGLVGRMLSVAEPGIKRYV